MAVDPLEELLFSAVGRCILGWARLEMQLALLLRTICSEASGVADSIWDRVRSFDAKLQVLNDIATTRLKGRPDVLRDWQLLHAHILRNYGNRNKVAHGLMTRVQGRAPGVEPFFSLATPKDNSLYAADLHKFTNDFNETKNTIHWLDINRVVPPSPLVGSPELTPDLMHRLRKEDDLKREEQRLHSQSRRQNKRRRK